MAALYIKIETAKLDCFNAANQDIKVSLLKHFHNLKDRQRQLEARRATLEAEYCKSGYLPKLYLAHLQMVLVHLQNTLSLHLKSQD